MIILSEVFNGIGGKWILAKYSETFYGYGTEADFKSPWGLPVNQCGTKENVLEDCLRMAEINKEYIREYKKELVKNAKNESKIWEKFLDREQKELKMHTKFASILQNGKDKNLNE